MNGNVGWITRSRAPFVVGAAAGVLIWVGLVAVVAEAQGQKSEGSPPEVVVYASDLPKSALSEFEVWDDTMLVRNDPLLDATGELVADLQQRLAKLGRYAGSISGEYDDPTRGALADWAGEYNLEGRLRDDDKISQLLVREIRDVTPELDSPASG